MNKKRINSDLNYEAYSFFEGVSSDRRIFTAKIRLSLGRNTTQTTTTTHYDWSLRNNRNICDKYMITLRKELDALQDISKTPNVEYENFVNVHAEAAAECIPTKLSDKHRVPCETFAVREKLRQCENRIPI